MSSTEPHDGNKLNISGTECHLLWVEHRAYICNERSASEQVENGKMIMNFESPTIVLKLYSVDNGKLYYYIFKS